MRIVAANTTHAPAGLKVTDLLGIYKGTITTWNQIPGNAGGSTATIHPFLPPSDSAINKALINDLTVANGGSFTLAPSVVTVEQNDPVPIANDLDAITPFALGRFNVWNTPGGYFKNPNTAFPGGATIGSGVKLLTGGAAERRHSVDVHQQHLCPLPSERLPVHHAVAAGQHEELGADPVPRQHARGPALLQEAGRPGAARGRRHHPPLCGQGERLLGGLTSTRPTDRSPCLRDSTRGPGPSELPHTG